MENRLHGPLHDVAEEAGYADPPERAGFFTDTSLCIGCKACEVACKEWNAIPDDGFALTGMSYDNTGALGASTWRHVAFVEQSTPRELDDGAGGTRWLMASDVCKHCTHAACLDVCPTGALFRTEFATVVVQQDVCNGCAYCVSACPYGVIDRREGDGAAGGRGRPGEVPAGHRPAGQRQGPRLRQGVPDRLDPVRPARRAPR